MGCGTPSIQEKLIDKPYIEKYAHFKIHSLDEKFIPLENLGLEIERFRILIQDKKDELLLRTGACELKSPGLFKIFLSGLWKISADFKVTPF
jgi:hypothetical protein